MLSPVSSPSIVLFSLLSKIAPHRTGIYKGLSMVSLSLSILCDTNILISGYSSVPLYRNASHSGTDLFFFPIQFFHPLILQIQETLYLIFCYVIHIFAV